MKRPVILLLLVAVAALPVPAVSADSDDADAFVEQYLKTFNAPDHLGLAALYTEDGLVLPPWDGPVKGREAIGRYWSKSTRNDLSFRILQKNVCGDAGYYVGSYLAQQSARYYPASPFALLGSRPHRGWASVYGSFALGIRRDTGGKWRVASDMWTENSPNGFVLLGDGGPPGFVPAAQGDH
jgi:ketosteroid isomerase-like protein